MNNYPEVEILLATYNGEKYLAEQLDSIIAQTYQNWRITASDDGSSDSTRKILEHYAGSDNRIRVLPASLPHGSACANFMDLLRQSTADYVMFCDQDDVWLESKIEQSMNRMKEIEQNSGKSSPVLVYSDAKVVDVDLHVIDSSYLNYSGKKDSGDALEQLLMTNVVPGCTMLCNKALRELGAQMGGGASECQVQMHDWILALIASSCGYISALGDSTILYRQHESNVIGAEESSIKMIVSRTRNSVERFWKCVSQASFLLEVCGDKMRAEARDTTESFVALAKLPKRKRALHAIQSGLVKRNKFKAIHELIILSVSSPNQIDRLGAKDGNIRP